MLEFIILMVVLDILAKIIVGEKECYEEEPKRNAYDNGSAEAYIKNNSWEFKSLDDCMEFRELRLTGWKGNAEDFYKWKEEE
jgi:hypothetical protein